MAFSGAKKEMRIPPMLRRIEKIRKRKNKLVIGTLPRKREICASSKTFHH